ncbi:hypothetical protein [Pantanalinema sp. GBBB05]|uniref:hypothetical protein n=1 Tax=Pantanalinema sp. GBBB05 TaxID=2604139 RepID=UPI001D477F90|nr:hypothetical protein [Pantanalinema sp. GBBB05]
MTKVLLPWMLGLLSGVSLLACQTSTPVTTTPATNTATDSAPPSPTPTATTTTPASDKTPSDITGTYTVKGTNMDGSRYEGKLAISPLTTDSGNVYTLNWDTGNTFEGIGILRGNMLSVGWGSKTCTIVAYETNDKNLDGQWVTIDQPKLGTEMATRASSDTADSLAGSYAVTGKNPNGDPYSGTLVIKQQGLVYQFSWQTGDTFEGIGIKQGDAVAVGWGTKPSDRCAVVSYIVEPGGTLSGTWGVYGQDKVGIETATRQ